MHTTQPLRRTISLGTFCLTTLLMVSSPAQAIGSLLVTPPRVILKDNQRSCTLTLSNQGKEEVTYRISWVQRRMNSKGSLEAIKTPEKGMMFADPLLRYSPKMVVLPPNSTQVVRMQLRKPSDLATGEYRSHLLFQEVPSAEKMGTAIEKSKRTKGFSVNIDTIYGVTIPIIVRNGETTANISFSDAKLERSSKPSISLRLNRIGNQSTYGDITLYYAQKGQLDTVIGEAKGIAVYTPLSFRSVNIPLLPNFKAGNGEIHAVYKDRSDSEGKILANTELKLAL